MLSDRQDKRLGFGQPSQLHATAGFAEYAGMLDSPFVVAVTNAQHSAFQVKSIAPALLLLRAK
jgi:hypothetical protein